MSDIEHLSYTINAIQSLNLRHIKDKEGYTIIIFGATNDHLQFLKSRAFVAVQEARFVWVDHTFKSGRWTFDKNVQKPCMPKKQPPSVVY